MRLVLPTLCLLVLPLTALAQSVRSADAVLDALHLGDLLGIMQKESVASGMELGAEMLPERRLENWRSQLAEINAPQRLQGVMAGDFASELPPEVVGPILDFLTSPQGERIVALELSAREALLDPDIEQMSAEMLDARRAEGDARLELIERFVEANDLVEANVLGAMNANAAFLRGVQSVGDRPADDDAIVAQVLAQEPEIRAETIDWVYGFLLMAYQPLSDSDMEAYIAFSQTDAGQALNKALFEAFDTIFVMTSRETGEALARMLSAQDI